MEAIRSFSGQYCWLSNFGLAPVMFEGVLYPTSEHAYQAAKSLSPSVRDMILAAPSPGIAKRLGRSIKLRDDWESVKLDVMTTILRDKYARHPLLAQALLATGDAELIEGNHWGDRFWGVCDGTGENHLGRILMAIRADLRGV
jgi:hypothetical protein